MYIARVAHPDGVSFVAVEFDNYEDETSAFIDSSTGFVDDNDTIINSDTSIKDSALLLQSGIVREIAEHPFGSPVFTGRQWDVVDVRFLAPILGTKIISITGGKNEQVQFVLKPNTTVTSYSAQVNYPAQVRELYMGSTIAVIIGRPGVKFSVEQAQESILGYCLAADITSLDIAAKDGNFSRAKAFDGFCPLGPWIDTHYFIEGSTIVEKVDNALSQELSYDLTGFNVAEIISELSHIMTLLPGDIVLLGSRFSGAPVSAHSIAEIYGAHLGTITTRFYSQ